MSRSRDARFAQPAPLGRYRVLDTRPKLTVRARRSQCAKYVSPGQLMRDMIIFVATAITVGILLADLGADCDQTTQCEAATLWLDRLNAYFSDGVCGG